MALFSFSKQRIAGNLFFGKIGLEGDRLYANIKIMISYLYGKILNKNDKSVIIDTGGVGYRVFMSQKRLLSLKKDKIELFCHTNSKPDPWEIYGFISSKELELFEFLIGISRVGPKTALEASAIGSLDVMKKGIKENDSILMKELFSLGQRKAQAIIFEVSRKIKTQPKKLSQNDEEVMKALVKLGFKRSEVKDAVIDLSDSSLAIETKIKKILKSFNEK